MTDEKDLYGGFSSPEISQKELSKIVKAAKRDLEYYAGAHVDDRLRDRIDLQKGGGRGRFKIEQQRIEQARSDREEEIIRSN